MKHPTRGGQNLTDRYRRLEKSLRGKGTYQKDITELAEEAATLSKSHKTGPGTRTFMGFVVPEEPKPPASDDCCMSGCAICVYDLYDEALDEYKKAVEHLQMSLTALRIPEDQWPEDIQTEPKSKDAKTQRKPNPTLSAFEEFEARLKQKHANDAAMATSGSRSVAAGL
ncbi:oxidoreductase-like protein [Irpex rosettiformis]|uniref:Oxidoreductase-like protein n=1 Tax=Irpex rosettiformis TaxID=378272 RepID=A0ACB8TRP4_9APHY|nr:oxidoreductase-like protein [Irpex rosettiformis]